MRLSEKWDRAYFAQYGTSTIEERCATPINDLLEATCGTHRLATFHGQPGGEWDFLRLHVSLSSRRRLTGAGWMTLHGIQPDVFEDWIGNTIEWYVKTALQAIPELQRSRNIRRHHALAERNGHDTYYEHRTAYVQSLGYTSIWHYRKAMKWNP